MTEAVLVCRLDISNHLLYYAWCGQEQPENFKFREGDWVGRKQAMQGHTCIGSQVFITALPLHVDMETPSVEGMAKPCLKY